MHYQGSWRYTSGFGIFAIVIGICFLSAGLLLRQPVLIVIGLGIFLYLLMIGLRFYVELLPDRLVYRGWFNRIEVKFEEVLSVHRAIDLEWPRNRIYGPLTYEIRTPANRFFINLLYFGPDFSRKFQELFVMGNIKQEEGSRGKSP